MELYYCMCVQYLGYHMRLLIQYLEFARLFIRCKLLKWNRALGLKDKPSRKKNPK